MRTAFDDVAVLHDEDAVGIFNGREAVCDDEAGSSFGECVHGFLYLLFGSRIDAARGFIEDNEG